jgi:hypothetical protein
MSIISSISVYTELTALRNMSQTVSARQGHPMQPCPVLARLALLKTGWQIIQNEGTFSWERRLMERKL